MATATTKAHTDAAEPLDDPVAELLEATRAHAAAKRTAERAKARLDRAKRAVDKRVFPRDAWRELPVLGKRVRRRFVKGARTFSLTGFETAGHTVTPEMAAHITEGRGYDVYDVEDA